MTPSVADADAAATRPAPASAAGPVAAVAYLALADSRGGAPVRPPPTAGPPRRRPVQPSTLLPAEALVVPGFWIFDRLEVGEHMGAGECGGDLLLDLLA